MNLHMELILYVGQSVKGPHDIKAHADAIAAACTALGVHVARQDDLSTLSSRPAIGLEAQGSKEQLDQLVKRLIEKSYVVEDGGRQVHALDEEGGAQ